jgi:hypothetical protein
MVFIDFSRIMAGKLTSEKSIKAAVRSELSRFDPILYNNYGLFGYLKTDSASFEDILIRNLDSSKRGFNYLKFDVDNLNYGLTFEQEIILLPVVKNQILEEMKYLAPINFQQRLFKKIEAPVKKVADSLDYYNQLQEVTDKYLARNDLLNQVFELQISGNKLVPLNAREIFNEIIESAENLAKNELSIEQTQIVKEELSKNINFLLSGYKSNYYNLQQITKDAEEQLFSSEQLNYELIALLNTYDETLDYSDTVLADSLYAEISQAVELQEQLYSNIVDGLNALSNSAYLLGSDQSGLDFFALSANSLKSYFDRYDKQFYNLENYENRISQNKRKFNKAIESINHNYNELVSESKNSLFSLQELFNSLKKIVSTDENAKFIEGKYDEFVIFNDHINFETQADTNLNLLNISRESESIFGKIKLITEDYLIQMRDAIYFEEYAFERFTSFDQELSEETLKMINSGILAEDFLEKIHISQQELEYVIYGKANSSANIGLTLRDIYLIRFVFNIFDRLLDPVNYKSANPVSILLEATIYAFKESIADLQLILQGNEPPIMKKLTAVKLGYIDYLKILYLCRGGTDEQILRQLALVEYKTGRDLLSIYTYGIADIEIAMDLWFLPNLQQLVGIDNRLIKSKYKRFYVINSRAAYGY